MKRYGFSVPGVGFDVMANNRWQALRRAIRWYRDQYDWCESVGNAYGSPVENIQLYVRFNHRITMANLVCVNYVWKW